MFLKLQRLCALHRGVGRVALYQPYGDRTFSYVPDRTTPAGGPWDPTNTRPDGGYSPSTQQNRILDVTWSPNVKFHYEPPLPHEESDNERVVTRPTGEVTTPGSDTNVLPHTYPCVRKRTKYNRRRTDET